MTYDYPCTWQYLVAVERVRSLRETLEKFSLVRGKIVQGWCKCALADPGAIAHEQPEFQTY